MTSAYTSPVIIKNNVIEKLDRIKMSKDSQFQYNEAWLQDFLYKHPDSIPFSNIDTVYGRVVSVCRELGTQAGPIDVLYVTPEGKLVILEAKLWRNPEARRKVVAQILDYAKELNKWTYEDLQREISRATGKKGNVLYDIVKEKYPDVDEAGFVDEVSRSLSKGEFMLLIVGDGISEGTRNIAEFMQTVGRLQFSLGLIEVAIYQMHDQALLVQPRVLAKTNIIERTVIDLRNGNVVLDEPESIEREEEISEDKAFYTNFWKEFTDQLNLDDVSVPMSENACAQNFYLYPGPNKSSWVSAYFAGSKGRVGVYFRVPKGEYGKRLYDFLRANDNAITAQIGDEAKWAEEAGTYYLYIRKNVDDIKAPVNRPVIFKFFNKNVNNFVNALRPLLKAFENQA